MDKWLTIEAASKKLKINKANLFDLVANKELKLTWDTNVELVWLYKIYGVDDEPLQVLPDGSCIYYDEPLDNLRGGLFELENSQEWDYVFKSLLADVNLVNDVFFEAENLIVREISDNCKWRLYPLANNGSDNITYHPIELPRLSRLGVMSSEVSKYRDNKNNGEHKIKNLGLRQVELIKGIVENELKLPVRIDEAQSGKPGNKNSVLTFIESKLKTRLEFNLFSLGGKGKFERSFFDTAWKKYIQELKKATKL